MIQVLISFFKNIASTYRNITRSIDWSAYTKESLTDPAIVDLRVERFQQELTKQNEKHIVPFIVAICFAIIAYIGYDYLTLPLLWTQLLIWRLFAVLCGVIVIVLFSRKYITALTAWAIFFIINALTTGYFVSLYNDPILIIAGNVNLSMAMFILPLALLIYPLSFNIILTIIFIANYLFWHFMNSSVAFSELLIYGGIFQVFAILVSLFGHWSKIRSTMKLAELNLIIETKNIEILEQNHKLELQATYDLLTGAYNRGFGLKILEDRILQNHRDNLELAIVYIDVDNLKITNDSFGHRYGDRLILGVVDSIRGAIRESDLVCRMGGDEFLLVMNSCSFSEIKNVMIRIGKQLEVLSCESPFPYEISWGALSYDKEHFQSTDEFIERADQIMYESKQAKKDLRCLNNN